MNNWRKRVGAQQAQQITTEAASRGTRMHKWLENYVCDDNIGEPGSNPYSQQSHKMASGIVEKFLTPNVTEIYGTEISLYYPGLYAGTTDCVANWQGEVSILDFKKTNKPKKTEWVTDYFLQLCAYALAHNEVYGTNISQGVILMCSQEYELQHWVITGAEFEAYTQKWIQRVDDFYR